MYIACENLLRLKNNMYNLTCDYYLFTTKKKAYSGFFFLVAFFYRYPIVAFMKNTTIGFL